MPHPVHDARSRSSDNILPSSQSSSSVPSLVLDNVKASGTKEKSAKTTDADDDDDVRVDGEGRPICSICEFSIGEFGGDDQHIVETKCGHYFGNTCIHKWIRDGNGLCPACRRDLRDGLQTSGHASFMHK
jgi:hypothetical protein